ncbi:MAG: PAS domain S-box protein [Bacteroidales bacterium]|nr:PAS domain S-box protein [Bacteroidales bacterium]
MSYKNTIILAFVITGILFTVYYISYEQYAQRQAQQTIDRHARVVADALWNYNDNVIKVYLNLATKVHNYMEITIVEPGEQKFIEIAGATPGKFKQTLISFNLIPVKTLTSAIKYQGETIGRIEAEWYPHTIFRHAYVLLILLMILLIFLLHMKVVHEKRTLEQKVNERTSDLTNTNKRLEKEIADRGAIENELRQNEEQLRITLNSIGDAVITTDIKGRITAMNPVARLLTGWDFGNAKNRSLSEVFTICNTFTGERLEDPVQKVLESGKMVGLANHTMLINRNGKRYQIADSAAPIKDEEDSIYGIVLVFNDVTEEYHMREALQESELQLKEAQAVGEMGSWHLDLNTGKVKASAEAHNIYGLYKNKELSFEDIKQVPLPQYRAKLNETLDKLVKGEGDYKVEFRIKQPATGRILDVYSVAQYNAQKHVVTGIIQNITERKRAEKALRKSEEKYRLLFENIMNGFAIHQLVTDEEGNPVDYIFLEINKAFENQTGLKKEHIIGKKVTEVLPGIENSSADWVGKYGRVTQTGEEARFEQYSEQLKRWYSVLAYSPVKGQFATVFEDITGRKQVELALQASEERFRRMFNDLGDGVFVTAVGEGDAGTILEVNPAAEQQTGYSRGELIGMNIAWDLADQNASEISFEEWDKKLKNGEKATNVELKRRKDGTTYWTEVVVTPVEFQGRHASLSINRDITKRKNDEERMKTLNEKLARQNEEYQQVNEELTQTNEELHRAKDRAEESDRLKSAFLANMSHEIRTPMNGILGFAGLLKEGDLTGEEQHYYINVIEKSGERMLNTINDLVNISKIEAGQEKVRPAPTNINQQLDDLYNFFKPEVDRKGLQLTYKKPLKEQQALISTDPEKLNGILTNLIKNAIKYTHEGRIEFGYRLVEKNLEFYVSDTGIGIPQKQQKLIFDRFVQADLSITKPYEGFGLGLSITKAYVEMLGGFIWLKSEEGQGSTFLFTITYAAYKARKKKTITPVKRYDNLEKIRLLTILIVEDESASELYLTEILKGKCKNLLYAKTGNEAISIFNANPNIDLILMDIKMPEMDGFEATRKIREFNKEVKIIAQTAYALEGDREKALEAGCDEYVSKPIKKEKLLDLLISMTSRNNDLSNEDTLETEG